MKHRICRPLVAALLLSCLLASQTQAYNPPVDSAGPLVVRIEGPEVVTETEKPVPVRVIVENQENEVVEGTLQVQVIDGWRVEPGTAVEFSVEAKGTTTHEFQVVAGKETYSAHYPIHGLARFQWNGKQHTAHPILILQTKLPPSPPAAAVTWKAFKTAPDGRLALWQLPVQRAVVQVFGRQSQTMPAGWQGSESRSKASLGLRSETLGGQAREAIAIHPPWFEGRTGTMLIEFPLELPKSRPLKLHFATAVTPTGKGDGVTFRVRVAPVEAPAGTFGEIVFERHTAAKTWQEAEADLSQFAGKTVRLQLESHPGPNNDTGWDQSYWAEPTLVAGTPPEPPPFPPKDNAGSRVLGTIERGGRQYEVRLWPGQRGLLDAVVGFRQDDKRLYFRGFEVRVLGGRIDDCRSPILLVEAKQEPCPLGYQVRHHFESFLGEFDLVGRLFVEQGVLRATFALDNTPPPRPWTAVFLEDVAAGPWSRTARRVYAGHGNVVRDPESFRLGFDGHRLATSFVGFDFDETFSLVQGVDVPPDHLDVRPSQRHCSLHVPHGSTWTFIPAENAFQAANVWHDVNGLEAAAGVRKLAGRFVFDLWGGRYRQSREALEQAFRYGLTDAAVIWHNWQRWGYDYRLPEIYPANPQWGTHEELGELVRSCQRAGVLFALHDNYIDFYPDAEGFSYQKQIAFHRDGTPVMAWLNEGRGARSYRYRADAVEPFLQRNLKLIRDGLTPDAYFIDVWTSICPYDYWTAEGKLFTRVSTNRTWGRHFQWIRELLGDNAPQISESGHDALVGRVDGAQTNHLRVGKPIPGGRNSWCVWNWQCADAERIPWFDVAHHDRFVLHGAGYPSRYPGGLDQRLHGIYSDDYMATEVLTGHPAMVSRPQGREVVRKYWLLRDLMRALALRRIENVEFAGGDLHRQHVTWSGGGRVWVNRGESDWKVAGKTLPQYGFLARVPTDEGPVKASITRRDAVIVEAARSPGQIYVNGRRVVDPRWPIRMSVERTRLGDGRRLEMDLSWEVDERIPADYRAFLHFVDAAGEIVFQAGCDSSIFLKAQTGRMGGPAVGQIPADLEVGQTLELRIGFYRPADGNRLALAGPDDGTRRIRIGTLRLEGKEGQLGGIAWTPHQPQPDPWLARRNPDGKPIDFGPLTTAGGCRLTRDGNALMITPLPSTRGPKLTVRVRPSALPWQLPELTHVETVTEDGKPSARQPIRREGEALLVECEPGVFAYRLTGNP